MIFEPIPLNEVANNVPVTVAPILRVSIFLFPPSWYKETDPFCVASIACSLVFVLTLKCSEASISTSPVRFPIYKFPGAPS